MRVHSTYQQLKRFNDFNAAINRAVKSIEKQILDLNRDQMYEDGVMDINNPSAILHYAPSTIRQKRKRASYPRTDHITLKWEGDFHKALKIRYGKEEIEIFSDDKNWKEYLQPQDRFQNALGLTDASLDYARELIKDKLLNNIRDAV